MGGGWAKLSPGGVAVRPWRPMEVSASACLAMSPPAPGFCEPGSHPNTAVFTLRERREGERGREKEGKGERGREGTTVKYGFTFN